MAAEGTYLVMVLDLGSLSPLTESRVSAWGHTELAKQTSSQEANLRI